MASSAQDADPMALFDSLGRTEVFWRDNYLWLKERGYQLRPRFSPDWIPSWKKNGTSPLENEDGYGLTFAQINDAIHIPSGRHVAIKLVRKINNPTEVDVMRFLSSEALIKDKRNHCIPLLEVLRPLGDDKDDIQLLVMPYARPIQTPRFDTVGEVVQCIREILEALQFMHENRVAHRDLNSNNIMMESHKLFPKGHHHDVLDEKPDLSGPAPFYTRTQRPTKYYVIDFGLALHFDGSEASLSVPIIFGGDRTVPEFRDPNIPQNPFMTDIYFVGNFIREHFLQGNSTLLNMEGYKGTEFLQSLVDDMVQDDPAKRPTIDEVLKRFNVTVGSLSSWKLRSRTPLRGASRTENLAHLLSHWTRKIIYVIKGTPAVPQP